MAPDNPAPAIHEMTAPPGSQADPAGLTFAQDRLSGNAHGDVDSHIDVLCHAMYRKTLYNGVPAEKRRPGSFEQKSLSRTDPG